MLPEKSELNICFAHVAYRMQDRFAARGTGINSFQAWSREELLGRLGEADVLVISGLWRNDLLDHAPKLLGRERTGSFRREEAKADVRRARVERKNYD